MQFRSEERAQDFIDSIKRARPHTIATIEPVYSKRLIDRSANIRKLIGRMAFIGTRKWKAPSRSEPGVYHIVYPNRDGDLKCNCTAGMSGSTCDHIIAAYVIERSAEEATPF